MLPEFQLAWESWGELSAARDNAILILTGMSPDAHAAASEDNPEPGWWDFMIGPGKPIDTNRWFVVCANSLGSCKGSTGPASINPETGKPWALGFPELSLEDIAETTRLLLVHLEIEQLAAVVGPSMGGMTALALCSRHPDLTRNLISISSAPHATPFAIAIRSLQREAIRCDPDFNGGAYHEGELPLKGMRIARKMGMLSYRSAKEWLARFGRDRITAERRDGGKPFEPEFEIESYLEAHAEKFINTFDPNCYLYLSRAMDWFDIGDYGVTVADALARLPLRRALVVGVETDVLFPIRQQRELTDALRRGGTAVTLEELPSVQGHDAFLVDEDRFGPAVANFLRTL